LKVLTLILNTCCTAATHNVSCLPSFICFGIHSIFQFRHRSFAHSNNFHNFTNFLFFLLQYKILISYLLCYSQSFPWRSNYLHSLVFPITFLVFFPTFFWCFFSPFSGFCPYFVFWRFEKNGKRKKKNEKWYLEIRGWFTGFTNFSPCSFKYGSPI
jgi:hypothetical protein